MPAVCSAYSSVLNFDGLLGLLAPWLRHACYPPRAASWPAVTLKQSFTGQRAVPEKRGGLLDLTAH